MDGAKVFLFGDSLRLTGMSRNGVCATRVLHAKIVALGEMGCGREAVEMP